MSDFIDGQLNPDTGIDFSKAQKLPGGGSTCDIYKAISQRRKVFVKRLKPEFRNMPLYLSAFDKEYDIGVNLNHISLPKYIAFYEDYIVMDFIDGKTLAELIQNKDPWLAREKNVIRLLRQLLEVIDYLHQHNVVHCDIKPDNIMITADNRNLMLIDLDKCYTDWLDDTSGDPSKFGWPRDKKGKMSLDYHCVVLILEKIKEVFPDLHIHHFNDILKACKREEPNAQDILEILDLKPVSKSKNWLYGIGGLVICGLWAVIIVNPLSKREFDEEIGITEIPLEPVNQDSVVALETLQHMQGDRKTEIETKTVESPAIERENLPAVYTDEEKCEILDRSFQPMFNRLHAGLTELQAIKQDSTLSWVNMLDKINDFVDLEQPTIERAFGMVNELFPETKPTEVAKTMALSKIYMDYMHRSDSIQKNYSVEMKRRRDARK